MVSDSQGKNYRDLIAWQKAMDLVTLVYKLTEKFPQHELYGLTSQIRRCAVSIPSNIAEGSRRGTRKENGHFLYIAYGSGAELETQLEIADRLGYSSDVTRTETRRVLDDVMRLLNRLTKSFTV
jgi:four helix bundle protein